MSSASEAHGKAMYELFLFITLASLLGAVVLVAMNRIADTGFFLMAMFVWTRRLDSFSTIATMSSTVWRQRRWEWTKYSRHRDHPGRMLMSSGSSGPFDESASIT